MAITSVASLSVLRRNLIEQRLLVAPCPKRSRRFSFLRFGSQSSLNFLVKQSVITNVSNPSQFSFHKFYRPKRSGADATFQTRLHVLPFDYLSILSTNKYWYISYSYFKSEFTFCVNSSNEAGQKLDFSKSSHR